MPVSGGKHARFYHQRVRAEKHAEDIEEILDRRDEELLDKFDDRMKQREDDERRRRYD